MRLDNRKIMVLDLSLYANRELFYELNERLQTIEGRSLTFEQFSRMCQPSKATWSAKIILVTILWKGYTAC